MSPQSCGVEYLDRLSHTKEVKKFTKYCSLCKLQAQTASKILNEELEWIKIFNEYTLLGTDPISKNVAEKRIAFIQSELDKLKAML